MEDLFFGLSVLEQEMKVSLEVEKCEESQAIKLLIYEKDLYVYLLTESSTFFVLCL